MLNEKEEGRHALELDSINSYSLMLFDPSNYWQYSGQDVLQRRMQILTFHRNDVQNHHPDMYSEEVAILSGFHPPTGVVDGTLQLARVLRDGIGSLCGNVIDNTIGCVLQLRVTERRD
eukprot:4574142-Amphidinium_carterae.1